MQSLLKTRRQEPKQRGYCTSMRARTIIQCSLTRHIGALDGYGSVKEAELVVKGFGEEKNNVTSITTITEFGPGYTLNLEDNSITADRMNDHTGYLPVIANNHNVALTMVISLTS